MRKRYYLIFMLIVLTASAYMYVNRINEGIVRFEIGSNVGGG